MQVDEVKRQKRRKERKKERKRERERERERGRWGAIEIMVPKLSLLFSRVF